MPRRRIPIPWLSALLLAPAALAHAQPAALDEAGAPAPRELTGTLADAPEAAPSAPTPSATEPEDSTPEDSTPDASEPAGTPPARDDAPAPREPEDSAIPTPGPVQRFRLGNGLRVAYQRDPRWSFSAVCLAFGVGSSDDPEGLRGLAHLTEHTMFGPFPGAPNGFDAAVQPLGATYVNATTGPEVTTYCTEVPAANLPALLHLEAGRMGYLLGTLGEEDVARERLAVLNEQHARGRHRAGWRIGEWESEELWPEGPPRRYSDEDGVEAIRLEHVQWFHQTWYGPANAVLAIVGPEPLERVRPRIERELGVLRGARPPARSVPETPRWERDRYLRVGMLYRRSELHLVWRTPAYFAPGDAALDVVATLLDRRLEEAFEDLGDVRVSVRQYSGAFASTFRVSLVGPEELDVMDVVLPRADAVLAELAEEVDEAAVADARRGWAIGASAGWDRALTRAAFLARWTARGRPLDPEDDAERYRAVTHDEVRATIRRLREEGRLIVHARFNRLAPFEGAHERSRWR
ncbi:MAG: hypothetical protein CMN31_09830 [Sandaracinus sp.]|nr:hypothetical protein [Sandaracinus sp.]